MAEDRTEAKAKETAYVVRSFEASCKIEHPTTEERNFRIALMKRLGLAFGLKEVRDVSINQTA